MKRILIITTILTILFLLLCSQAWAATYYIAADTGNDTTGDGSSGTPWATLAHAHSEASAADILLLKCTEQEEVTSTITISKALTIGAYYGANTRVTTANFGACGGRPKLDGAGTYPTNQSYGLLSFQATVTFEFIEVEDSYGHGIKLETTGDDSVIQYCHFDNMGNGGVILSNVSGTITQRNRFENTGENARTGAESSWAASIQLRHSSSGNTIKANYSKLSYGEGIGLWQGPSGNTIEWNRIEDHQSASLYGDGSNDNIWRYNMLLGSTETTYGYRYQTEYHGPAIKITHEAATLTRTIGAEHIYGNFIGGRFLVFFAPWDAEPAEGLLKLR